MALLGKLDFFGDFREIRGFLVTRPIYGAKSGLLWPATGKKNPGISKELGGVHFGCIAEVLELDTIFLRASYIRAKC